MNKIELEEELDNVAIKYKNVNNEESQLVFYFEKTGLYIPYSDKLIDKINSAYRVFKEFEKMLNSEDNLKCPNCESEELEKTNLEELKISYKNKREEFLRKISYFCNNCQKFIDKNGDII